MISILRVVWSSGNILHIAKHNVTPDEVEEAIQGPLVIFDTHTDRYLAIGRTHAGRMLSIVLSPMQAEGAYYVVTARDASDKERRLYQAHGEAST